MAKKESSNGFAPKEPTWSASSNERIISGLNLNPEGVVVRGYPNIPPGGGNWQLEGVKCPRNGKCDAEEGEDELLKFGGRKKIDKGGNLQAASSGDNSGGV
ncbi:hypothetical protein Ancab_028786 [Ancistrocladus abbreviatus]